MIQSSSFIKTTCDLSPEILNLAEKEELGELRKVYPVWKPATYIWQRGTATMAFGVIVLVSDAILIAATLFSPKPPLLTLILELAAAGLLLLIGGCYLCFSRRIYARQVYLWQYGFIYEKGQIRQVFRWDHIESVEGHTAHVVSMPSEAGYTCKVRRQDGYEVKLAAFSDIPELIDIVLEASAYQLAPQELRIVPPKSARTFTDIKLDRQGIGNEQETLSWQEIREMTTKNGTVILLKKEE